MFSRNKMFTLLILTVAMAVLAAACKPVSVPAFAQNGSQVKIVEDFYYWYLGYAGNPMADGAYRERPELSQALVAKVDGLLSGSEHSMFDPFLCAQDIPEAFNIEDGESGVMVHEVWNAGAEYEMVRTVQVNFVQEAGGWKINDIICPTPAVSEIPTIAPPLSIIPTLMPTTLPVATATQVAEQSAPEGWQRFEDAVYGYHIAYPPGWSFEKVEIRSPELAAPVVQIMVFAPQEIIEAMNQPGPPDPTKPPVVPPLNVEVSMGAMDKYRRMYPEPATSETMNINGYTVVKEAGGVPGEPHQIRYIFQSPADENLRVTLIDNIIGFEARAEGNEAVIKMIQHMLKSFAFG